MNPQARYALVGTQHDDPRQSGYLRVQTAAGWHDAIAFSNIKGNAGVLVPFGQAADAVEIHITTPIESLDRPTAGVRYGYRRLGHVEFLAKDPGDNLAFGATTAGPSGPYGAMAIGTTTGNVNPAALFDGWNTSSTRWRANGVSAEHFTGVVFDSPVVIDALRIEFDTSAGSGWKWSNFDLLVRNEENEWIFVGRASQSAMEMGSGHNDMFTWINMGGMTVTGVMLYGANAPDDNFTPAYGTAGGNNPAMVGGGKILAQLQVWGHAVPEPATMSLLALGGLALLRRRK